MGINSCSYHFKVMWIWYGAKIPFHIVLKKIDNSVEFYEDDGFHLIPLCCLSCWLQPWLLFNRLQDYVIFLILSELSIGIKRGKNKKASFPLFNLLFFRLRCWGWLYRKGLYIFNSMARIFGLDLAQIIPLLFFVLVISCDCLLLPFFFCSFGTDLVR